MQEELVIERKHKSETAPAQDNDDIHLLDLLIALAERKWLVIGMPVFTGTMALIVSLIMTPIFNSTAKIMPPQQGSGVSAMLGQLGGLAAAGSAIAGIKNPGDLYIGMLESRTVADNLIVRFYLKERYSAKTMDEARVALANSRQIVSSKKDGMILVTTSDKDPVFAADLANAFVDELTKLTERMAISEAAQRRLFFEKQLKDTKDQLANAEVALRNTQEKTGMIQPEGQLQAIISSIAQLKGSIAAKEVQIKAMRTFATPQNPELLRSQEELSGLQAQLMRLEKSRPMNDGDFMLPSGKIPEAGVEYVRSLRNVKYYETMFEILAKQYELAKIDEAKNYSTIQLLDKAVPAERKSKPKRALIVMTGLVVGAVLGVLFAFMHAAYVRYQQHEEYASRWRKFLGAWKSEPR